MLVGKGSHFPFITNIKQHDTMDGKWMENGWKMDGKWMEHAKMCKDSQEHLIRNDGSDAGRRIHPFCCAHSYHTLYIVYCPLPVDIKLSSVPGCLIAIRRSCLSRSLSFDRMQF